MKSNVAMADAAKSRMAIAAAAPISPASSRFRMAMAATFVSGEYRNTTAEIVVIALMKKYRAMSTSAGEQIGSVTRQKVWKNGTFSDALTASNSASSDFRTVT